ncbi:MAG: hypothetical protein ACRDEA_00135 [Microcystaceae cyanobacterium]
MPVSTTVNPVTQTAEVVVNKATMGLFQEPSLVENGISNNKVPTVITARNPRQIVRAIVIVKGEQGMGNRESGVGSRRGGSRHSEQVAWRHRPYGSKGSALCLPWEQANNLQPSFRIPDHLQLSIFNLT